MKDRYTFVLSFKPDSRRSPGGNFLYDGYIDSIVRPPAGDIEQDVVTVLRFRTYLAERLANGR